MGRLFIFQNSSKLDSYIRDVAMPDMGTLIFQKRVSSAYEIKGHPISTYSSCHYDDEVGIIYHSDTGRKLSEEFPFKYSDRASILPCLSRYSEICIVTQWNSVDDYFMSVCNYLLSLTDSHNDCLPISVCDHESSLFGNRRPLSNYMEYSTMVRQYRNKEYMNIATLEYFKDVYDLDLDFDHFIMMNVVDSCMNKLYKCPYYFLNNNLNNGLLTIDEGFNMIDRFAKLNYLDSYEHDRESCIKTNIAYMEHKNTLLRQQIDYVDIYNVFDDASRFEHSQFKIHISNYFKQLKSNHQKEMTCNY